MIPLNHVPAIQGAAEKMRAALSMYPGAADAFEAYSNQVIRAVAAMQDRLTALEKKAKPDPSEPQ